MLKIISIILGVLASLFAIAFLYFNIFFEEPKYIQIKNHKIENVKIQPKQALELAKPFLNRATRTYYKDKPLEIHIVLYKNHYYISMANYPAKSAYYYLKPAVKVHVNTGKISFVKKQP